MQLNINSLIFIGGTAGVIVLHALAIRRFGNQAAVTRKYRYFAIRDELVYLVASDHIAEDDFVFQQFYNVVNFLITNYKTLTLNSFLRVLRDASAKGMDPTVDKILARLLEELPKKDAETKIVVATYFKAVIETLLENSRLLRVSMNHPSLYKLVRKTQQEFHKLPSAGAAFKFYRQYEKAVSQMTAAA